MPRSLELKTQGFGRSRSDYGFASARDGRESKRLAFSSGVLILVTPVQQLEDGHSGFPLIVSQLL